MNKANNMNFIVVIWSKHIKNTVNLDKNVIYMITQKILKISQNKSVKCTETKEKCKKLYILRSIFVQNGLNKRTQQ